jgi:hypothetical protein
MVISLLIPAVVGLTAGFEISTLASHAHTQDTQQAESTSLICPKCKGSMERGVSLDYWSESFSMQSEWALQVPTGHLFKALPKGTRVTTYRCTECGYLESYAK